MSMSTNLGKILTDYDLLSLIMSHDRFIKCSCKIMWQNKPFNPPLL